MEILWIRARAQGSLALLKRAGTRAAAREDEQSRATRGLIAAMLLYDAGLVALLAHARIYLGLSGVGLWPAIFLHMAMGVWCLASLPIGLVQEKSP